MPDESPEPPDAEALRAAVHAGLPAAVADLARLIRLSSPVESAAAVARLLEATGAFDEVRIETGAPVVVATREPRRGASVATLHGSHGTRGRETGPLEPTLYGDRLLGPAAAARADLLARIAGIRALLAVRGALELGLSLEVTVEAGDDRGADADSVRIDDLHAAAIETALLLARLGTREPAGPRVAT
jgi:hypothetical protein